MITCNNFDVIYSQQLNLSKSKLEGPTGVTNDLQTLYSLALGGAIDSSGFGEKELQVAGFEFWKNMLKS